VLNKTKLQLRQGPAGSTKSPGQDLGAKTDAGNRLALGVEISHEVHQLRKMRSCFIVTRMLRSAKNDQAVKSLGGHGKKLSPGWHDCCQHGPLSFQFLGEMPAGRHVRMLYHKDG
jgi:hypothetical protein